MSILFSVDCTEDFHCSSGQSCQDNMCSCADNSDCADAQSCQNGKCQQISCNNKSCGNNAQCTILSNEAICKCDSGYYSVTTPDAGCGK